MLSCYFSCTKSDAWLGGANTLKYFRTFQVFVEILNGNNVRKCEKKSASFTVYVVLCETNCTNEVKAHFRWVRPQRRSCRCTLLRSRKATERSSSWEVVFWKVRRLQTEKNCDAVKKKGLISALFEARWSCKSWGLITSHEVMQRNRTQRYDLSVLKWHPHTPFCLFTLGCNMKSLFSIRHTVRTCLSNRVRLAGPTGLWRNLFPIMSCMKHLLFPWSPRELPGDSQAGCELLPDLSEPPSLCLGASY